MTFLALIIAVLLLQAWGSAERVQYDDWFDNWCARVQDWGLGDGLNLLLAVAVPVVVISLVLDAVSPLLFGFVWLLLAVLVLLYSFGRGDFEALMAQYRGHVCSGDFEAAYLAACERFPRLDAEVAAGSARDVHRLVQRELLYEGLQRWFAVTFYFVLLGPGGALGYRLAQLYSQKSRPVGDSRLLTVLDWVPARLLAATFSITGDFISSRDMLMKALGDTAAAARDMLISVATAALGPGQSDAALDDAELGQYAAAQNRELAGLLSRSAVCWVVAWSLLVLLL